MTLLFVISQNIIIYLYVARGDAICGYDSNNGNMNVDASYKLKVHDDGIRSIKYHSALSLL